jgi:hypothetical protein
VILKTSLGTILSVCLRVYFRDFVTTADWKLSAVMGSVLKSAVCVTEWSAPATEALRNASSQERETKA